MFQKYFNSNSNLCSNFPQMKSCLKTIYHSIMKLEIIIQDTYSHIQENYVFIQHAFHKRNIKVD